MAGVSSASRSALPAKRKKRKKQTNSGTPALTPRQVTQFVVFMLQAEFNASKAGLKMGVGKTRGRAIAQREDVAPVIEAVRELMAKRARMLSTGIPMDRNEATLMVSDWLRQCDPVNNPAHANVATGLLGKLVELQGWRTPDEMLEWKKEVEIRRVDAADGSSVTEIMTVERLGRLSPKERAQLFTKYGPDVIDVAVEEVEG